MNLIVRAACVWLALCALAFVNGALREIGLKMYLGVSPDHAHQISCLTGIILWTSFLALVWKKLEIKKLNEALYVGASWFIATMVFETFILNRNLSRAEIIQTYDVGAGQLWGLVLLWIGIMPVLYYYLQLRLQGKK